MSRLTVVAVVLAALVFGMGSAAQADPVSVGAMIRLYDGPGYNSGGEFYADVQPFDTAAPYDFITFCLQRNEYFSPGQSMYIGGISDAVLAGGDEISPQTAYLYTSVRNGTLQNYAFSGNISFNGASYDRAATATALQLAFWQLEEENTSGLAAGALTNFFVNQANTAVSSGAWTGIGDVRVLNLFGSNPSPGVYSGDRQDQLTLIQSVPEPSTLSLLGLGLFVTARLVKKRRPSR